MFARIAKHPQPHTVAKTACAVVGMNDARGLHTLGGAVMESSTREAGGAREVSLANTAPQVSRHVLVRCGLPREEWPAKPELEIEAVRLLNEAVMRENGSSVKVTCTSQASSHEDALDLIVLPDMVQVTQVHTEQYDDVAAWLAGVREQPEKVCTEPLGQAQALVVCTHGNRDKRCGTQGVQTYEKLVEEVDGDDVVVLESTHVGGHAHAPNVICYPASQWLGKLDIDSVAHVCNCVLAGDAPPTEFDRGVAKAPANE